MFVVDVLGAMDQMPVEKFWFPTGQRGMKVLEISFLYEEYSTFLYAKYEL